MLFILAYSNLSYTLATEEAERIGVDHVVRTSTHENGSKSTGKKSISTTRFFFLSVRKISLTHRFLFAVAEHLMAQYSAIKMLHSRVKLILAYIKSIENGSLPANSDIFRETYALNQRLPVIQSSAFKKE